MPTPEWIHDDAVRDAVEVALPSSALATLDLLARGSGVPRSAWLTVSAWRVTFTAAAVVELVDRLEADGMSWERAVDRAAARLGIPTDTATNWLKRARRQALGNLGPS